MRNDGIKQILIAKTYPSKHIYHFLTSNILPYYEKMEEKRISVHKILRNKTYISLLAEVLPHDPLK